MKTTHLDVGVFEMMLSKAKELAQKAKEASVACKGDTLSDWLDAKSTCSVLHAKPSTLQTLRITGKLPYSQIGNKIFYKKTDIQKLIGNPIVETNIK